MKAKLFLVSIAVLFLITTKAMAVTFGDGGTALQGVLDNITTAPIAGDSSVDVKTDKLSDAIDSYWEITAQGTSGATIIIELAGFAGTNKFGIYDPADPTNVVQIFAGGAAAGAQATVGIKADGSVWFGDSTTPYSDTGIDFAGSWFGYYLDATVGNGNSNAVWYSDTSLNYDDVDHMYAYQGKNIDTVQLPGLKPGLWTDNEYILAFEDLDPPADLDYTDMVLMVESVRVPVPGAVLLGILGLGIVGLKLRKYA